MKTPPINFGIYFVSDEYLKTFSQYINKYSYTLFKPNRPFVCIYPKNDCLRTPYFVPLQSINPDIGKKEYNHKLFKWRYYQKLELDAINSQTELDKFKKVSTVLFVDTDKQSSKFKSIASLSKTIPVPNEMLTPKLRNGEIVRLNKKDGNIISSNLDRYLKLTTVKWKQQMPIVGYLNILADRKNDQTARTYAIDHNKLTAAIKLYKFMKSEKSRTRDNMEDEREM